LKNQLNIIANIKLKIEKGMGFSPKIFILQFSFFNKIQQSFSER